VPIIIQQLPYVAVFLLWMVIDHAALVSFKALFTFLEFLIQRSLEFSSNDGAKWGW
jgi:hypothetical protein